MSEHPFTLPDGATVYSRPAMGGVQHKVTFTNGRGASVIQHHGSYGGDEGLWEVAVVAAAGHLDYTTPITNDVLGRLTENDVDAALAQIAALPSEVSA
jgi:hypothetical protein